MGKISRDCDKELKMLRVEKVGTLSLSGRICGPRRHIRNEDYVGLPTESFIGQGRNTTFSENSEPV